MPLRAEIARRVARFAPRETRSRAAIAARSAGSVATWNSSSSTYGASSAERSGLRWSGRNSERSASCTRSGSYPGKNDSMRSRGVGAAGRRLIVRMPRAGAFAGSARSSSASASTMPAPIVAWSQASGARAVTSSASLNTPATPVTPYVAANAAKPPWRASQSAQAPAVVAVA